MSRRLNVACSLGAAVLLTQCVVAQATFTTPETETFNLSTSAFGFTVTDGVLPGTNEGPKTTSANLSFDKFNTALGTLLGVELTFASTLGSVTTINVSFTENVFDSQNSDLLWTSNGSMQLSLTGPGLNVPTSLSPNTDCIVPDDSLTCSDTANNPGSFDSALPISLTPLANFLGPGTFVVTATLDSAITPAITTFGAPISFLADNSTMTGTLATNWQGSVSVRYEYEEGTGAVPGPMTLYLLLAGGAGLVLLRRRLPGLRAMASALARTSANRT